MRRLVSFSAIMVLIVFTCGRAMAADPPAEHDDGGIDLFNGRCLAGWKCFALGDDVKMKDIWSVEDGVIVCKGQPLGYLYTEKEFTNYKLEVEWRWAPGKKAGNSGILLRIDGDAVSFLPKCAECQLQSGSAGDIYGFYGYKLKGPEDRFNLHNSSKLGKIYAVSKAKRVEKDSGKWNKAEITVDGNTITVVINGEEVNRATDCDITAGNIGLQSEGGEIHFRKVRLTKIKK